MLARELSFDPKVVVFNKPTYGLDVKTTATVRDAIRELADGGGAALVISTDLDELLEICDRIAVLSRGRLVGVVENGPGAAEQIGELMVGAETVEAQPDGRHALPIEAPLRQARCRRGARGGLDALPTSVIRSIVPVLLALIAGGHPAARARPQPVHVLPRRLAGRRRGRSWQHSAVRWRRCS